MKHKEKPQDQPDGKLTLQKVQNSSIQQPKLVMNTGRLQAVISPGELSPK